MAVEEIHAEMVSSVWKVLVEPGAEVAAGDTLVILESMKMEIPVLTERAGTVQELHVVEGEVLQEGDLIATVVGRLSSEVARVDQQVDARHRASSRARAAGGSPAARRAGAPPSSAGSVESTIRRLPAARARSRQVVTSSSPMP